MLGGPDKVGLATKAAETSTLLVFCCDMATKYCEKLGRKGPFLVALGNCLVRLLQIMRNSPRVLGAALEQEFVDNIKRAFTLCEPAGVPYIPKSHMMLHLGHSACDQGNPYYYHTFVDESLNGSIAKLAATCHRMTFYKRVLEGFRDENEQPTGKRRR